jgi:hypothetical protein
MSGIFGHAWTSAYGASDDNETWLEGLADMSPNDIKRGIAACLNWQERFPPTLPQFRALCRPAPIEPAHRIIERERLLPQPPEVIESRRNKALGVIEYSKQMLRMAKQAEILKSQTISEKTDADVAPQEFTQRKSPKIQSNEEWLKDYADID